MRRVVRTAPVAPIGWPWAMAPPSTLTISSGRPSSRATTMTIAAKASLISIRSTELISQPARPRACLTAEDIAHEQKITPSYATRLVRLTFLAPDIVAAILAGKQPAGLTANKLMADTRLPLDWRDQRAALGFASAR